MAATPQYSFSTLFRTEQQCVAYLFHKRWPQGFQCPFCTTLQKETAPAYTVVCRNCRKQTSITAHTLMHRSRKSLVAWMLAAWLFCCQKEGISAREIQRLMELTSYQTAWTWLQKIRLAAANAESPPCKGTVLFTSSPLSFRTASGKVNRYIGIAVELNPAGLHPRRLRLTLHKSSSLEKIDDLVAKLVRFHSVLLLHDDWRMGLEISENYSCLKPTEMQLKIGEQIVHDLTEWLSDIYRNNIKGDYLQSYLDEFSFRCNTASWSDRLSVFDHLLTGLLSTDPTPPAMDAFRR